MMCLLQALQRFRKYGISRWQVTQRHMVAAPAVAGRLPHHCAR